MPRSRFSRRALLLLSSLAVLPLRSAAAQQSATFNNAASASSSNSPHTTPLIDQLRVGLRTNTSSQMTYLQLVVAKVEAGELPQAMINVVYRWAIKRNPQYPFPYFQYALKELAKRRGVTL